MHLLTAFSLKNRALISLVTIVAAVFGLLGVGSLKQELMPSVQFPAIAVVTSYPGASPEVVNKDVSGPIETALRGVPQLESSSATSSTGSSMVVAEFTYGVDITATEQKVERAISRISKMLPAEADTQVLSGSVDDFPVIQIAVTPAEGETPEQAAQMIERVAIPELSDLDGVRDAQLSGARAERVTIRPDAAKLADNGLTSQAVTDALQQSGVLIAAGTVGDGDRTLAVQSGSELTTPEEIAALPLPVSAAAGGGLATGQEPAGPDRGDPRQLQLQDIEAPDLEPVTIGEVAEVALEPGPQESISRVNGQAALTIAVTKMSAANTVDVSHAVQESLDGMQDQLGGAKLTVIFDQAPYVEQSIETLTTEGLLGLVFAVLVILVFLMSVRATLVTAISIPTSVLLTFVGLNFAEYTLNMLTLGALTISIGRVVDDSIVVIENIKRHIADGPDRVRTIVRAVREVAGAITASTVTTVAVFLPMAFVDGMVGELFRPFAFTVTIALVASLFVSLTIVPVLAYWFLRPESAGRKRRRSTAAEPAAGAAPTALQRGYRPIIEWTLARPLVTLIIAVAVFAATMAATPLMKTNYMGEDEQNSVGLVQTLAPGTSLDAQLAQVERVEAELKKVSSVETVQVTIGSSGGGLGALFGGGGDGTVNYSLTTDPDADQVAAKDDIRAAVDGLKDAGEFSLGQSGGGVTASSAIEIDVAAPDQDTLAKASEEVVAALGKNDALKQVESDLARSRPYLSIAVDRMAAARAGLTEAGVAGQVAQLMQPSQIGQITIDSNTVSVYLANGQPPADVAGVQALEVQTAQGPERLDALAAVQVADGPVTVTTADGVRTVTVSALPAGDDLTTASVAVDEALASLKLPAGASATVGGVMSQQADAFSQLGIALLVAILIVYVVMVATFRSLLQPLLLLVSVPFAATGALLLLIATGIPLGVASLIGVLMLIGIVVTNAIVLIDLVNQFRERGDGLRDAVLHGSLQRLRPIVMTALATILALTPMGLGITGKGGFISQPLAVVVIGGLLSSTVLTLVVLPTLYYVVERRRERGRERRAARRGGPVGAGDGGLVIAGAGVGAGAVSAAGADAGADTGADAPEEPAGPRRRRRSLRMRGEAEAAAPVPAVALPAVADPALSEPSSEPPTSDPLETDPDPETQPQDQEVPGEEHPHAAHAGAAATSAHAAEVEAQAEPGDDEAADAPRIFAPEPPAVKPAGAGSLEHLFAEAEPEPEPEPEFDPDPDPEPEPEPEPESEPELGGDEPTSARRQDPRSVPIVLPAVAPEVAPEVATEAAADATGEEPAPADDGEAARATRPVGPETAAMSLALSDLGFDEVEPRPVTEALDVPVLDEPAPAETPWDADPEPEAESEAEAEAEAEAVAESVPEPEPAPEPDAQAGSADPEPDDDLDWMRPVSARGGSNASRPRAADEDPEQDSAPAAPAPVTGELDWERLMWQATQEIDDEDETGAER